MITREWIKRKCFCDQPYEWWRDNCEGLSDREQLIKLAKKDFKWANQVITRMMHKDNEKLRRYAIYAAELVWELNKDKSSSDFPLLAIKAAKKAVKNSNETNRIAAAKAAWADRPSVSHPLEHAYGDAAAFAALCSSEHINPFDSINNADDIDFYVRSFARKAIYKAYASLAYNRAASESLKIIEFGIELLKLEE